MALQWYGSFVVFLRGLADGNRVEIMSILGMRGYSLESLWLRRLQTVDWRQRSSTLLLQRWIFGKMPVLELSPRILQSTFSPCKSPPPPYPWTNGKISCFQVVFTYLAIRQRNTIQIWGLVIFNACFVAYSAVQVSSSPSTHFLLGTELNLSRSLKSQVKSKTIHTIQPSSDKCVQSSSSSPSSPA